MSESLEEKYAKKITSTIDETKTYYDWVLENIKEYKKELFIGALEKINGFKNVP